MDLSAPDVAEREQVKEFAFFLTRAFIGVAVEEPSGARTLKQGFGTVPVPVSGERDMVPPEYVKNLCRNFGLDEETLRAAL